MKRKRSVRQQLWLRVGFFLLSLPLALRMLNYLIAVIFDLVASSLSAPLYPDDRLVQLVIVVVSLMTILFYSTVTTQYLLNTWQLWQERRTQSRQRDAITQRLQETHDHDTLCGENLQQQTQAREQRL